MKGDGGEIGKLEGQISGEGHGILEGINGGFTSHVFLTLEYNKGISTMRLLLLVGLFMGMGIGNDTDLERRQLADEFAYCASPGQAALVGRGTG